MSENLLALGGAVDLVVVVVTGASEADTVRTRNESFIRQRIDIASLISNVNKKIDLDC